MLAVSLLSPQERVMVHISLSEATKCRHQKEKKKAPAIPKDWALAGAQA